MVVYSHDDPEKVAYKFAREYRMSLYFIPSHKITYILIDLDIEMRKKLVILLKNQMSRVLTQINEGMEDQEE